MSALQRVLGSVENFIRFQQTDVLATNTVSYDNNTLVHGMNRVTYVKNSRAPRFFKRHKHAQFGILKLDPHIRIHTFSHPGFSTYKVFSYSLTTVRVMISNTLFSFKFGSMYLFFNNFFKQRRGIVG